MTPFLQSPFGRRILILAPHPDDEVVACAACIKLAQNKGARVFTLYLTHGCVARDALWPWERKQYDTKVVRRLQESVQAARQMNITPVSYADRPTRNLWRNLPTVFNEIVKAVTDYRIDQLWIPAYEGGHADHDALNAICAHLRDHIDILEFAAYNFFNGAANAQTFPFPNGTETVVNLSPEEQGIKRKLLGLYESERGNLGHIGVTRECYRPLASYDYRKPPHEGTLWYTRFHWVPFKHPRIDFSRPEDVCAAIDSAAEAIVLPEPVRK